MSPNRLSLVPSGDFCFGRDDMCGELVCSAFQRRAVLLFGGRQAGKSTVLLRIARLLGRVRAHADQLGDLDVPVYADLLQLPYDATPAHFFRMLARRAKSACESQLDGFCLSVLPSDRSPEHGSLDIFTEDMQAIFSAGREVNLRVLFLLDEVKRILGDRFPRGFQDNLFSLLYGDELGVGDRIAIVFAGRQDLYRFCEDQTSPIGSRAASRFVTNLSPVAVQDLVKSNLSGFSGGSSDQVGEMLHRLTGGHAGLTVRLLDELLAMAYERIGSEEVESVGMNMGQQSVELFRLWGLGLSGEARCIHDILADKSRVTRLEIAAALHARGFDPIAGSRACEELQFTGIAAMERDCLVCVNALYWDLIRPFVVSRDLGGGDGVKVGHDHLSQLQREVWDRIEELEVALRLFVRARFEGMWPGAAIEKMRKILGTGQWAKLEDIKERSAAYYRYSPDRAERDVMECMYLGQIADLMVSNEAWALFKDMFRDKREFQDMLSAITPVRNDRAHFSIVPQKELDRCRIACDDLLVIIDREQT